MDQTDDSSDDLLHPEGPMSMGVARLIITGTAPFPIIVGDMERAGRLALDTLDQAHAELDDVRKRQRTYLHAIEEEYVRALNACLAVPGGREDDDDLNRWRGHAEAYRTVCEMIRRSVGLPAVRYQSDEWRRRRGVYQPGQFPSTTPAGGA